MFSESPRGSMALKTHLFCTCDPQHVREYMSVVLSHPTCKEMWVFFTLNQKKVTGMIQADKT